MKKTRLVLDTIILTYVAIKAAEGMKMMFKDFKVRLEITPR